MISNVITYSIILLILLIAFAWAVYTVESQLQGTEFSSMVFAFQILGCFDESAFKPGSTNYVSVIIEHGRIDVRNITYVVEVTVDLSTVYTTALRTLEVRYRGGWLVSPAECYYRGDPAPVSTSPVIFCVHTTPIGGASVILTPRVRVAPLGVYQGLREDGSQYSVYMIAVYLPEVQLGEAFGSNPYRLVLRTVDIRSETASYASAGAHKVTICVNGTSVTIWTPAVDEVAILIVHSTIKFDVRGA